MIMSIRRQTNYIKLYNVWQEVEVTAYDCIKKSLKKKILKDKIKLYFLNYIIYTEKRKGDGL